jgi:hypothetical protein
MTGHPVFKGLAVSVGGQGAGEVTHEAFHAGERGVEVHGDVVVATVTLSMSIPSFSPTSWPSAVW